MARDNDQGHKYKNKHKNTRVVVIDRDRDHRYYGEREDGRRYTRDRNGRVIVIRDDVGGVAWRVLPMRAE